MCYNCGCRMKDDDMGHPDNITIDDIAKAAIASGENGADTLHHMRELLAETTPEEIDKKIAKLKQT